MEYNIVFIDATFSVEGMRPLPSSRAMYSIDQGYPAWELSRLELTST